MKKNKVIPTNARSPIVTILGHVDHGKTSLLDFIRKSRITTKEHGGITQKIGAYEVDTGLKDYPVSFITFIDTPGHEAFTKLRSRGAQSADIAVLVIDGKDSLMPQTIESIAHIKASKIPFIVAINKCDLPEANPQKVERDLLKHNIQTEHQGGAVPAVKISAKTGLGIPELLETILLMTSDLKLTYDPAKPVKAIIVETNKDKRGVVASVIVQDGILRVADTIYTADATPVKIRALMNDLGKGVREITPSTPALVFGFDTMPEVGTLLTGNKPDVAPSAAQPISDQPLQPAFDLQDILAPKVEERKLGLVIKTDSQGSLEALDQSLSSNKKIDLILAAVGDVHRSDIFLAKATGAIVIGFAVNIDPETQLLAQQEKVVIKTYNIIYELIEELEEVASLIAEKEAATKNLRGEAKVLASFEIKGEKVYGLTVVKGKLNVGDEIEVFREGNSFGKAEIISLKFRAKTISEAKKGEECGMLISPPLDMRAGDVVKCIL